MDQTIKPNLNWVTRKSLVPSPVAPKYQIEVISHSIITPIGVFKVIRTVNHDWRLMYPEVKIHRSDAYPSITTEYKTIDLSSEEEGRLRAFNILHEFMREVFESYFEIGKPFTNAGK